MSDLREIVSDPNELGRCIAAVEAELTARTRVLHDRVADHVKRVETLDNALRQKEGIVLKKDDDLRAKDDDLRAKDRTMTAKDAHYHAARDRSEQLLSDLARVEADLKEVTTDLLQARGKLNMRGVLEYIEEREQGRMGFPRDTARAVKWELILARRPRLVDALLAAYPDHGGNAREPAYVHASRLLPRLWGALSLPHHPVISPESTRKKPAGPLTLSEDAHDGRYTEMLACLCQYYYLSYARVRANGVSGESFTSGDTERGVPAFERPMPAQAQEKLAGVRNQRASRR